jgi:hypothetical protein
MRRVFLVGESLPKKTGTAYEALGIDLVAIDPRHGVFPNLVAKPLLSALYWLNKEGAELKPLLDQLDPLMTHTDTKRRFNVFGKKASKEPFRVDPELQTRLNSFNTTEDLWLVFGVQTSFGLLGYLTGKFKLGRTYKKGDILKFASEFLTAALKHTPLPPGFPARLPSQRTARLGLLHRLCTDADSDGNGVVAVIRSGLKKDGVKEEQTGAIIDRLRSMVPLLHNEAYQDRYDIGYNQAHFVLCQGVGKNASVPPQLYWRVMGEAIAERLRGNFVQR